uniref:Uncharacterized protein n=1 Tax=Arundo donax TaxID=35708 RepID=A0A0A9F302_ARUDO
MLASHQCLYDHRNRHYPGFQHLCSTLPEYYHQHFLFHLHSLQTHQLALSLCI